jgi:hypothetical protein
LEQRLDDPALKGGVLNRQVPQTVIWDDITLKIMFDVYERSLHIVPLGSEPSGKRLVSLWQPFLWEWIFVLRTKSLPRERPYAIVFGRFEFLSLDLFFIQSLWSLWLVVFPSLDFVHNLLYIFLILGQVGIDLFIIFRTIFILIPGLSARRDLDAMMC